MQVYRNSQIAHGYLLKPNARPVEDFTGVIARSYDDKAPFLNRLLLARFFESSALVLRSSTVTGLKPSGTVIYRPETRDDIVDAIIEELDISRSITFAVPGTLDDRVLLVS